MYTKGAMEQAVTEAIKDLFTQAQLDEAVMNEMAKWDKNGDGRMGLEEAIRCLQIVSGINAD